MAIGALGFVFGCGTSATTNIPSPDSTYYGGRIQVTALPGQATLPLSKIDEIKQVPGVKAAFPTYRFDAKTGQAAADEPARTDLIISSDPTEAAWSSLRTNFALGHAIDADSSGEVVLGSKIAKELNKKIGDTVDFPLNLAADAGHSFNVVGILGATGSAPDNFAYVNITDGQMLLTDSLPAAQRDQVDVTSVAQGIDVFAKSGTAIAGLDRIADQINQSVSGVKATGPSQLIETHKTA